MFFLSQTLQRHRLLDLHEFLGKIVVVTALGLVLVAIYGGLVSWVGDRPELFYFNTVVASFVILSLFEPMRERVEEGVVATLFHERYELCAGLEMIRHRTRQRHRSGGPRRGRCSTGSSRRRRVTHCSLWLLADDRPGYRLLDFRGPPPVPFLEPATAARSSPRRPRGQKAILLENIDRRVAELARCCRPAPPSTRAGAAAAPRRDRRGAEAARRRARGDGSSMKAGICVRSSPATAWSGSSPAGTSASRRPSPRTRSPRSSRSPTAARSSSRTRSSTSRTQQPY